MGVLEFMSSSPFLTAFLALLACVTVEAIVATLRGREPALIRWFNS